MEIEKENIYLNESYIIKNNDSKIINNNSLDNIGSNQENNKINSINKVEVSENKANTSQANKEDADTKTDNKTNFKSIVHLQFDKDKNLKNINANIA
ncbi:12991_t:CDS:1, partial [Gigaspora margarita]